MKCELIKVCGMRDPDNIRAVKALGIDLMGLIFWPKSPRYVSSIPVHAGIIPDEAEEEIVKTINSGCKHVGVFVDEMPQTVITHAYNYHLDYIQLHGNESPTYIDNLKRTLIPDILPDVKIIKALSIREADDVKRWQQYDGYADLLLFDTKCKCVGGSGEQFDWSVLDHYDGNIPFILSGGIGPDDTQRIKDYHHPMCIGIDLNSRFEDEPALKNVKKLDDFIKKIRTNE
ncbi:MAG: phosphoribosylanthranilate isomerase [Prevotella sp.]|nr:phosphoribosylanthranilate isomerase [Candidatus Prevotella equi]